MARRQVMGFGTHRHGASVAASRLHLIQFWDLYATHHREQADGVNVHPGNTPLFPFAYPLLADVEMSLQGLGADAVDCRCVCAFLHASVYAYVCWMSTSVLTG